MNILVMGAGAVGCLVGGHLAASGQRVTLVGRSPLMQKVATDGLIVHWPNQTPQTVFLETAVSTAELSALYDFVFLTVKSPGTAKAVAQLATLARPFPFVISLQNGIGNEEQIVTAVGPEKIIAGTITIPVQMPVLGTVTVSKATGGLGLAPLHPAQPVALLVDILNQAGLATQAYDDYRTMKWSKLLLNITTNASCAILDQSPAQVIARSDLVDLEIEALREAVAVMQAQGIRATKLPGYPVNWLIPLLSIRGLPAPIIRAILRPFMFSGRGTKMPSLQIDLAAARDISEINFLNGAVVKAGQRCGIATPVNRVFTEAFNGLISGTLSWDDYQQQPDKLIRAIKTGRASQSDPVVA